MTPERWRQIGDLFDAAVRLDPAGREAWLRAACGGDDDLRAEVDRLLAQDERADRDGLLTPPEADGPPRGSDGELAPPRRVRPRRSPGRSLRRGRIGRRHRRLHPQGGDRPAHRATPDLRAPGGRAGAAARAADDLHPDAGHRDLLEAHRPRRVTI